MRTIWDKTYVTGMVRGVEWGGEGEEEMLEDISLLLTKQTSLRRLCENPCPRPVSSLLDTVTGTAVIHRGWPGGLGCRGREKYAAIMQLGALLARLQRLTALSLSPGAQRPASKLDHFFQIYCNRRG